MVDLVNKEGIVISFKLKGLKDYLKRGVKKVFKWLHTRFANLEDYLLLKIDKIGDRAEKHLEARLLPLKDGEPIVE